MLNIQTEPNGQASVISIRAEINNTFEGKEGLPVFLEKRVLSWVRS